MSGIAQILAFALAVVFMVVGLIGTIIPILPGTLLILLSALGYAIYAGPESVGWGTLAFLTLIGLIAGTADMWLPLLGAKTQGASKRAMFFGAVGAVIGTVVIPIPILGTVIGYAVGILLGEYHKRQDWEEAKKASLGGVAGWGVATAVQIGAGIFMIIVFIIAVLTG